MAVATTPPITAERAAAARRRRGGKVSGGTVAIGIVAWVVGLLFFSPVLWMFLTGFKQESQASTSPPTFFFTPTLAQYRAILSRDFMPFFINSLTASVMSTILVSILATPAAYALSVRRVGEWRGPLVF